MPKKDPVPARNQKREAQIREGGANVYVELTGEAAKQWRRLAFDLGGTKVAFLHLLDLAKGQPEISDEQILMGMANRMKRLREMEAAPPAKTARKAPQ